MGKFQPTNKDSLWTYQEAEDLMLYIRLWDGSDGRKPGLLEISPKVHCGESVSKDQAQMIPSRKDCKGWPFSKLKINSCGKCEKNEDSCRGCDGQLNSKAYIEDQCGV